ncbi:hypothetical protein SRHO_G00253870 [Serrasalmus rhombeus]
METRKDGDSESIYVNVEDNGTIHSEVYENFCPDIATLKAEILCPHGWRRFKSSCYHVSHNINTWDQGRQDCRRKEADLVIINSREEQIFVSGLASNFWIGLSVRDHLRQWKWVDGTLLISG